MRNEEWEIRNDKGNTENLKLMKKITIYICVVLLVAACNKEKAAFNKDVDDRINEQLGNYESVITGSANGWTATLETRLGSTYSFYFRFNDNNRVFMFCDFDSTTAGIQKESSFRLKSLQQPCLIFDTYSYIHMLADPDASVNGGYYGGGLISDFEFSIDTCTADSILLTGRFNGSKAIMRKASVQDRTAWENKQVRSSITGLQNLGRILNYFKRLTYNGTEYEIQINTIFNLQSSPGRMLPERYTRLPHLIIFLLRVFNSVYPWLTEVPPLPVLPSPVSIPQPIPYR